MIIVITPLQADAELLVRVRVLGDDRAGVELDEIEHRGVAEERSRPHAGGHRERRERVEPEDARSGHAGSMSRSARAASSLLFRPPERVWRPAEFAVASARRCRWHSPIDAISDGASRSRRSRSGSRPSSSRGPPGAHGVRDGRRRPQGFFIDAARRASRLGGLYFVVASGFTLVFGLMRVVNMAHGSLYLVGGYVAINVQRRIIIGQARRVRSPRARRSASSTGSSCCSSSARCSPASSALVMQQVLLRWNQGQDLRQALITIAVSVIFADQVRRALGRRHRRGHAFPGAVNHFVDLHVDGLLSTPRSGSSSSASRS